MSVDPTTVVFFLAIVFLAFYVAGGIIATRRLGIITRLLSKVLRSASTSVTYRKAGGSSAILSGRNLLGLVPEYSIAIGVSRVSSPFSLLRSKLWRGDMAVMRGRLKTEPNLEATFVRKGSPMEKYSSRWSSSPQDLGEFLVYPEAGSSPPSGAKALVGPLRSSNGIWMMTFSRSIPHIQVYISLGNGARSFSDDLRALGGAISGL